MKRFYDDVAVQELSDHDPTTWQVTLDGRGIRTVGGNPQAVPTKELANVLAREWADQGEDIDTKRFRLRDMADYAIDQISPRPGDTITKLLGFAETDTLCYRADPEDALYQRQLAVWEPIVAGFEEREGIKFVRVSGIVHRAQDKDTLAALRRKLERCDPFTLAGLELLASLSASLCVALTVLEDGSDPEPLWRAASLEEEWQADLWGRDAQAEERRANRRADFLNAAHWLDLLRG